ncbi:MAG: DNA replication complex GINS family protein [archaeon]|nr:DNA replication complex GINS family protein [archaeon]MCP8316017.1 DNA replication complex GINS family protein [archaeon]
MSELNKESSVISFLKDHEIGFLLIPVKVIMKQDLPHIDIGSINLPEAHEGDVIEVPRWVAEIMVQMDFAELQEESFNLELFKALSRERMQDPSQISTLKGDFYLKMKRQMNLMKRDESLKESYEKFSSSAYDLIASRTSKLLYLAGSSILSPDLERKITPEEKNLFELIRSIIEDWKKAILEVE